MSSTSHQPQEERFEFSAGIRRKILILGLTGIVLFVLGVFLAGNAGHDEHAAGHAMVASADAGAAGGGESHGPTVTTRIYTSLWQNNVFFAGIGLIGLFFIAIQYAAQAGWSAPLKRIPLAIGHWIPFAGIIMLVVWFLGNHDLFHWTHSSLYDTKSPDYDKIIDGKGGFFFWPLAKGSFPIFFVIRLVGFFGLWYLFFTMIRKQMLSEDLNGGIGHWLTARKYSAIFLVIFAFSSSIAAWDWVMSIDTHWFSTMMGWYVFASWWVTGLAVITLIVSNLKDMGYLKMVNDNHMHDLGKFLFGFSVFWTYIWFSQFMLIYYAHIPEETVYFIQRKNVSPYSWVFYVNLILNFVLPFLLLMPRDAKRKISMLKVVTPIIIVGHWFDFYLMVTPGVMKNSGGIGFLEIGLAMVFLAGFLYVVLSSLTKFPLVARQHPMMEESLHHHI